MKSVIIKVCSIAALSIACLGSAYAGQGGKKTLQPIYTPPTHYTPSTTTTTTSSYSSATSHGSSASSYSRSYSSAGSADALNRSELNRLSSIPAPQPQTTRRVVQQGGYQQRSYTSPAPQTTYHTTAPAPVYHQPAPAPVYQHPAPAPTYSQPVTTGPCPQHASQGGYAHQPAPCGSAYHYAEPHPSYLPNNSCGKRTIRRVKNTRDGRRQYEVCFSDLMHLSEPERNFELLDRMTKAAKKACRNSTHSFGLRAYRSCREDSLEESVLQAAHIPGLIDAYFYKTGKKRPKVHVGNPIYY